MRFQVGVITLGVFMVFNLNAQNGEAVYKQTCVACHGEDGKGVLPGVPDFTLKGGRLFGLDSQLLTSMREGMQSDGSLMAMPAKGGNLELTDEDLKSVLKYMRDTFQ